MAQNDRELRVLSLHQQGVREQRRIADIMENIRQRVQAKINQEKLFAGKRNG